MDAYCFECSCSFSDIRVPIRAKSAPSRTEAMFPFPMSIAVLKAKTPRKGVKCRRVSQCGWLSAKWRDASQFKNKMNPICEAFTACVCASAPAVQAEGVLALQVRRERCRGKRREEGREEAHPARVKRTHVRLLEAADLQLGGLMLRVHRARERPPVEVAPLKRWPRHPNAPLQRSCASQPRRVFLAQRTMLGSAQPCA